MKSTKDFRNNQNADTVRKAVKLEPNRKNGKERHEIYKNLNGNDEDEDEDYKALQKRESILDYIGDEDDEEFDEEEDDDDYDEEEEDYDEEEEEE